MSTWLVLGLAALLASGALYAAALHPSVSGLRPWASLLLQLGGVIVVTTLLADNADRGAGIIFGRSPRADSAPEPSSAAVLTATAYSVLLIAVATAGAVALGLAGAAALAYWRERPLSGALWAAAVIWTIPTFLVATLIIALQALVYNRTGLSIAGSYGEFTAGQVLWAAVALGIRPAVYMLRHGHQRLVSELAADHVRAASARGLGRLQVFLRQVVRPSAATMVAVWLSSSRLIVGSLPLVEFLFGYPGLGRALFYALGGHSEGYEAGAPFDGPLVIALVTTLAVVLLLTETAARALGRRLDPRLAEGDG